MVSINHKVSQAAVASSGGKGKTETSMQSERVIQQPFKAKDGAILRIKRCVAGDIAM